jgi:hypothetical protein
VGLRLATAGGADSVEHPEPRVDVTAAGILPPVRYAAYPQVSETYDLAREIPQLLDGLYRMHTRGESLQAIRAAVDAAWGA